MIATYPQIGVVIARVELGELRHSVLKDSRIDSAASTRDSASSSQGSDPGLSGPLPGGFPNSPAADSDNLSGLQWDMAQIHTPGSPRDHRRQPIGARRRHRQRHGLRTPGSGAELRRGQQHRLLQRGSGDPTAGQATCSGTARTPLASSPPRSNGVGIVGVAPNVRIAAHQGRSARDFFLFPEMIVLRVHVGGTHHMDVTNNSYFADPWLFNCAQRS